MIQITKHQSTINLTIEIYLINKTNDGTINLYMLANAIKKQIEAVYTKKFNEFELMCIVTVTPLYKYKLKQLVNKLIFAVSNYITNNNVAEANFCGSLVKINANQVSAIINKQNVRTVPHEVGHLLGFDHPHARAKFNSVNEHASELEKNMTEEERRVNLMSQTWYIQESGVKEIDALNLTESQLKLLIINFDDKHLNKNNNIKASVFGWRWTTQF